MSARNIRSLFDNEEYLKMRRSTVLSIRKQKRGENERKRRAIMATADATHGTPVGVAEQAVAAAPPVAAAAASAVAPVVVTPAEAAAKAVVGTTEWFRQMSSGLKAPTTEAQIAAAVEIRKVLSNRLLFLHCCVCVLLVLVLRRKHCWCWWCNRANAASGVSCQRRVCAASCRVPEEQERHAAV